MRASRRLTSLLHRLRRSERGGVAIMFSMSLFPLALFAMGSVDYSRAIGTKVAFQDALDAAALAVARNNLTDPTQMNLVGRQVLEANLGAALKPRIQNSSFVRQDTRILASASLSLSDTLIMPALTIGASTEAKAAGDRLEVALVLDNTYSMVLDSTTQQLVTDPNATKLHQLKVAAKSFIDRLADAAEGAEAGAVKVALVPFSNTVRVGSEYQNASWIDPAGNDAGIWNGAAPNRFTLFSNLGQTWAGCVEARGGGFDVLETAPTTGETLYTPYFAPDEWDRSDDPPITLNDYKPDGSTNTDFKVRQRATAKYTSGQSPGTSTTFKTGASPFGNHHLGYRYGPNMGCRLTKLRRLTTNLASLKTDIDGFTPVGETIIPLGLAWGWNVLSPDFPWPTDAANFKGVAYNHVHQPGSIKTRKIVVLMTDGDNIMKPVASGVNPNESLYSGYQYGWTGRIGTTSTSEATRASAMDSKVTTLCSNMKAKGVFIYTIRVEVTSGTDTVLRNCATTPDMYYDVQNASQLNSVFTTIAGRITRLRLSQ